MTAIPTLVDIVLYWESPENGGTEHYSLDEETLALRTARTLARNYSDTYVSVAVVLSDGERRSLYERVPKRYL